MRSLRNLDAPYSRWMAWTCLAVLSLNACDQVDRFQNELRDQTPHEAYLESLRAVNLAGTALGTQWTRAAVRSLRNAPTITLPFEEEGFLFAETPEARSYRVELRRGQRLSIDADLDGGDPFRFFIDVYRMPEDVSRSPLPSCPPSFSRRVSSTSPRGGPTTSCGFNPSSCAGAGIASCFVWMHRSRFQWSRGIRGPS